ncbi:cysteine-rich repeat secretory protein 38-like protein [Tanacetum coccineum]
MEKFIIWAILIIMAGFGNVEGVTHLSSECSQTDRNSSVNTIYRTNLRNLLGSLVNNAPLQSGYFNNSVGNGSNQVYGLAWCRGDVSPQTCSECLTESISIPLTEAILGLLLGSLDYNNFEKNELRDEKQKLKIDIERLEQQLKSTFCGPSTTFYIPAHPVIPLFCSGGGELWHKGDVIMALVAFLAFYLIP